jgi:transcriptional regulator with XRE-family HTH domain
VELDPAAIASGWVRAIRRYRNLSTRELAELSGVPKTTINRIETERTVPRLDTFLALLGASGLEFALLDERGVALVVDDDHDQLRDRGERRFPAHLFTFKTPELTSIHYRNWWGWDRIAFGVPGEFVPEYTFRRRGPRTRRAAPEEEAS